MKSNKQKRRREMALMIKQDVKLKIALQDAVTKKTHPVTLRPT